MLPSITPVAVSDHLLRESFIATMAGMAS